MNKYWVSWLICYAPLESVIPSEAVSISHLIHFTRQHLNIGIYIVDMVADALLNLPHPGSLNGAA